MSPAGRCPQCGKTLGALRRLTSGDGFCSDACRRAYHGELSRMALDRLIASKHQTPRTPLRTSRSQPQPPEEPAPVAPKVLPPCAPAGYLAESPQMKGVEWKPEPVEALSLAPLRPSPPPAPVAQQDTLEAIANRATAPPPTPEETDEEDEFLYRDTADPALRSYPAPAPATAPAPPPPAPAETYQRPAVALPPGRTPPRSGSWATLARLAESAASDTPLPLPPPVDPPRPARFSHSSAPSSLASTVSVPAAPPAFLPRPAANPAANGTPAPRRVSLVPALPCRTAVPPRPLAPAWCTVFAPFAGKLQWEQSTAGALSTSPIERPSTVDPFEAALKAGVFGVGAPSQPPADAPPAIGHPPRLAGLQPMSPVAPVVPEFELEISPLEFVPGLIEPPRLNGLPLRPRLYSGPRPGAVEPGAPSRQRTSTDPAVGAQVTPPAEPRLTPPSRTRQGGQNPPARTINYRVVCQGPTPSGASTVQRTTPPPPAPAAGPKKSPEVAPSPSAVVTAPAAPASPPPAPPQDRGTPAPGIEPPRSYLTEDEPSLRGKLIQSLRTPPAPASPPAPPQDQGTTPPPAEPRGQDTAAPDIEPPRFYFAEDGLSLRGKLIKSLGTWMKIGNGLILLAVLPGWWGSPAPVREISGGSSSAAAAFAAAAPAARRGAVALRFARVPQKEWRV